MKRRALLCTIGGVMLAGCSDLDESESNVTVENEDIGDIIDIGISQPEWIDGGQAISVILTNDSDDYTAAVEVTVQWFDDEGRYIGQDTNSIPALEPNSSWYADIGSTTTFEAEEYSVSAVGYRIDDREVTGISTEDIDVDSEAFTVTGEIRNDLDTGRTLHVILSTYSSSWITHSGSVRGEDIPAETIWRFQTGLEQIAYDEPTVGDDIELTVLEQSPIPDEVEDAEEQE